MASRKEATRIHCSICGQISPESAKSFEERMAWLRRHRKEKHPEAFRKSVKKAVETREEKK